MRDLSNIGTVNILGIDVYAMRMNEVMELCEESICNRTSLMLGVLNVAKAVNSRKDKDLRNSLDDADVVLADGKGIVWLSRLMGESLPERVAGIDIMYCLLEKANERHYSVYFLGAKDEVVSKVVAFVKETYSGVRIAGYRDGYFDKNEEDFIVDDIYKNNTDILFVAIPSPKKENFLSRWREKLNVPVCHGVGGSFDVVAGITKRAPVWIQNCGMEWFFRLVQEPHRMWKRYLVTNTIFSFLSLKEIFRARFKEIVS